jgi:hypothetical protein
VPRSSVQSALAWTFSRNTRRLRQPCQRAARRERPCARISASPHAGSTTTFEASSTITSPGPCTSEPVALVST